MEKVMGIVYTSQKSKQSYKKGVKPYAKPKQLPVYQQGVLTASKPFVRETVRYPSLFTTGPAVCAKKQDKVYTGDSIVGIGTMHKSNAVPIFNDNQAKELATMRRG
jgi:hypothetical protein